MQCGSLPLRGCAPVPVAVGPSPNPGGICDARSAVAGAVCPGCPSGPAALFAHSASGTRPQRCACVLRPLRRGAPAAASRARSGRCGPRFAPRARPSSAPAAASKLPSVCALSRSVVGSGRAVPAASVCGRLRAPYSVALAPFVLALVLCPARGFLSPCPLGLRSSLPRLRRARRLRGRLGSSPGAVGGPWPPFLGLWPRLLLRACCARLLALPSPYVRLPCRGGCPALSPAPLPSPPPPLGAPGKREAVSQGPAGPRRSGGSPGDWVRLPSLRPSMIAAKSRPSPPGRVEITGAMRGDLSAGLDRAAVMPSAQGLDIVRCLCYYGRARLFVGRVALRRLSGVRGQQRTLHLGGWGVLFLALYPAFIARHTRNPKPGDLWRSGHFPRLSVPKKSTIFL